MLWFAVGSFYFCGFRILIFVVAWCFSKDLFGHRENIGKRGRNSTDLSFTLDSLGGLPVFRGVYPSLDSGVADFTVEMESVLDC